MMSAKLELLVPVELMPEEGVEVAPFKFRDEATSNADLLTYYLELTENNHLGFRVDGNGIERVSGDSPLLAMERSSLVFGGTESNGGQPWFTISESSATVDLESMLSGAAENDEIFPEDAEPEEYVRVFLERFSDRLSDSVEAGEGTAVPLVRWWKNGDGNGVEIGLCGIVLADDELLGNLQGDEDAIDSALGIVFEDPEVEGRGLREAAISLAVLGITLAGVMDADAGPRRAGDSAMSQAGASFMSSLTGIKLFDQTKGGKIQVIEANAVQDPARINNELIQHAEGADRQVIVDVEKQRAYVIINGEIAIDTPVSTAREGKHTPRGEFKITQRVRTGKTSTIYGCDLPYWQRLDHSAVGMHVGPLPGYPASAGCIRLPEKVAPLIFDATASGVTVRVVDSWQPDLLVAGL